MKRKILLWTVFVSYLLVLLCITVFRSGFGSYSLFSGTIVWVPFVSLFEILQRDAAHFIYLFAGNLIWFVPFGLLLPPLTGCRAVTVLLAFLLSLVIETLQFVFGTGVSEVEDFILNTLGAAVGYSLYLGLRHLRANRKEG